MERSSLARTTSILGFSTSIYLSGIYFSSSHLTLPVLYRLPSATSTSIFDEFYHRGAVTVVPLAVVSAVCSGLAAYLQPGHRATFAAAGGLTVATLAWTRLVMMGTIDGLIEAAKGERSGEKMAAGEVVEKLRTWRWMNMVRAGLSLAGGAVGLAGVLGAM